MRKCCGFLLFLLATCVPACANSAGPPLQKIALFGVDRFFAGLHNTALKSKELPAEMCHF